jgi:hypothetical protein
MKDKFSEHSCEFKNESDCEEELDEADSKLEDEESKLFGE